MKLANDIRDNQIILLSPGSMFLSVLGAFYKDYRIGYASTSVSVSDLKENLLKSKINPDNFLFIDTVSVTAKNQQLISNCVFTSSPGALAELRVAFNSFVSERNCSLMIFDNINDILEYNNLSETLKFIQVLIYEIKMTNKKLIFLEKDRNNRLHEDLKMFADKHIDLELNKT